MHHRSVLRQVQLSAVEVKKPVLLQVRLAHPHAAAALLLLRDVVNQLLGKLHDDSTRSEKQRCGTRLPQHQHQHQHHLRLAPNGREVRRIRQRIQARIPVPGQDWQRPAQDSKRTIGSRVRSAERGRGRGLVGDADCARLPGIASSCHNRNVLSSDSRQNLSDSTRVETPSAPSSQAHEARSNIKEQINKE